MVTLKFILLTKKVIVDDFSEVIVKRKKHDDSIKFVKFSMYMNFFSNYNF